MGALGSHRVGSESANNHCYARAGPAFPGYYLHHFASCNHFLPTFSTEGLRSAFPEAPSEGKDRAKSRLRKKEELRRQQVGTTTAGGLRMMKSHGGVLLRG